MGVSYTLRWVIVACILLLIVNIGQSVGKMSRAKERLGVAEEKVLILERQRQKMIEDKSFQLSENYLEKEIRDKLKLVKGDEVLVVLPQTVSGGNEEDTYKYNLKEGRIEINNPNWKSWLDLFL
jgi:hypothetical protein